MYEAFYQLNERPFNFTPDPHFLYQSAKHKEALAHLVYGIERRSGFVLLTGEIGTGKTTICRALIKKLDSNTEIAYIFDPSLEPEALLQRINQEFGIDTESSTIKELNDELNEFLIDRNGKGRNCVLLIDEAQNLTPGALEQIRLLSNLETETRKLLQIVLVGQPELLQHLQLTQLRQLNQRIVVRYHLAELDRQETEEYVAYRLEVAGGKDSVHFTRGAFRSIYRFSGGTPRLINTICDRALVVGCGMKTREITTAILGQAIKEIRGEAIEPRKGVLQSLLAPLSSRQTRAEQTVQPSTAQEQAVSTPGEQEILTTESAPPEPETVEIETAVNQVDFAHQPAIDEDEDATYDAVDAAAPDKIDEACGRFDWPPVAPDDVHGVEEDAVPPEEDLLPMETVLDGPETQKITDSAKGDDSMPQEEIGKGEIPLGPAKDAKQKIPGGKGEPLGRVAQVLAKINSVEESSAAVLQKVEAVVNALAGPSAHPREPASSAGKPQGLYEEMEARMDRIQQHLMSISDTLDRL